jgi:hypothetical protein
VDGCFEAIVCLLHVESQLGCGLFGKLLVRFHLVEGDEPLDDLAAMLEVLVADLIDRLDDIGEQRMQLGFGDHVQAEGIQKGDEVLGGGEDECAIGNDRSWDIDGLAVLGVDLIFGQANLQPVLCALAFDLEEG